MKEPLLQLETKLRNWIEGSIEKLLTPNISPATLARHLTKAMEQGLHLDEQGNLTVDNYQTSQPWVFAAGDAVSGASLVVHAINSGRQAATAIDQWLKTQN